METENCIKVAMADMRLCRGTGKLYTLGLGSCVAVALYDRDRKVAGMAHIMLPDSRRFTRPENPGKFADTAIESLLEKMVDAGADRKAIIAKIAGGARMFSGKGESGIFRIGPRNVQAAKEKLAELAIPIEAEDTGGFEGRAVEMDAADGMMMVRSAGKAVKYI